MRLLAILLVAGCGGSGVTGAVDMAKAKIGEVMPDLAQSDGMSVADLAGDLANADLAGGGQDLAEAADLAQSPTCSQKGGACSPLGCCAQDGNGGPTMICGSTEGAIYNTYPAYQNKCCITAIVTPCTVPGSASTTHQSLVDCGEGFKPDGDCY